MPSAATLDDFEALLNESFELETTDYPVLGARLADLGAPTLFVMECGYAVEAIGTNATGVLTGFETGA